MISKMSKMSFGTSIGPGRGPISPEEKVNIERAHANNEIRLRGNDRANHLHLAKTSKSKIVKVFHRLMAAIA